MGEILGLGITHYPGLGFQGNMTRRIKMCLEDPALPDRLRNMDNWPAPMREQWGTDDGQGHSDAHRQDMIDRFRIARRALDDFQPDLCVMWGDDQYENYHEDCVPAFSILAYESVDAQPWTHSRRGANVWDEPDDKTFTIPGHQEGGKYLASSLLDNGFDVAYSYKPLHRGVGHAFVNSVLYLDWDRKGFPYPLVPFTVNSYGRKLVGSRGIPLTPSAAQNIADQFDPPGPQPWRCFDIGAATARAFRESPWRVALIASSSWSPFVPHRQALVHVPGRGVGQALFPGAPGRRLGHLAQDQPAGSRGSRPPTSCSTGSLWPAPMAEIDRKPDDAVFLESWITNSDKVFALFRPREHTG